MINRLNASVPKFRLQQAESLDVTQQQQETATVMGSTPVGLKAPADIYTLPRSAVFLQDDTAVAEDQERKT